jgi:type I restriction enzyme M protein
LLDKYDIYQIIMDYWQETLQDDVYVITQDDWLAGQTIRPLIVKKGEKLKEIPDLIVGKSKYKAELIPPALIVGRYFNAEQAKIDDLQTAQDSLTQQLESYVEDNTAEDGLLVEALTDSGKVSKASVAARLKQAVESEEIRALKHVKKLIEQEATAKKSVKAEQDELDQLVLDKYPTLTISDIKTLVVEDKWLATLHSQITAEIERVTQQLANRVKTLEERYAEPLPKLATSVDELASKVDEHLKAMGLSWESTPLNDSAKV